MRILALSAVLLLSSALHAGDHAHRQHDAHQHGHAKLDLVQDGASLYLMLDTPAVNLLGFEHAPQNEAQIKQLHTVVDQLKKGAELFMFNPEAACQVAQATLDSALLKNKHEHEHAGEQQESHADFEVTYEYVCENPEQLQQLKTSLFTHFPQTEKLDAQWINAAGQHATTLTPEQTQLNF